MTNLAGSIVRPSSTEDRWVLPGNVGNRHVLVRLEDFASGFLVPYLGSQFVAGGGEDV